MQLSGVRLLISLVTYTLDEDSHLIAPGSTVTSATTISDDTAKFRVSAILIDPPESGVAGTLDRWNVNGMGTVPSGLVGTVAFGAGGSEGEELCLSNRHFESRGYDDMNGT